MKVTPRKKIKNKKESNATLAKQYTESHADALPYKQPDVEAHRREQRMKLTGLFMTVALGILAGTLTAIKTNTFEIKSLVLFPAAISASFIALLLLMAYYEICDLHCFVKHKSEQEYQTIAHKAELSFNSVFKSIPLLLYFMALMSVVVFVIHRYSITIPYAEATYICMSIGCGFSVVEKLLKEPYIPICSFLSYLSFLISLTCLCASYV